MKQTGISLIAALVILGAFAPAQAANLKDRLKVEIDRVELHPGMDPGMYVWAVQHLHIKATVENLAGVVLGQIRVAGKAYGPDRTLPGTTTSSTGMPVLVPAEKAGVDLEFLTVTGSTVQQVTDAGVTVIEAPTL